MKNKAELILIVILLLTASFLRLYKIDRLTNFQYDQARDALYTKRLVVDHKLRLIGPQASPGFYTGPAYYYLMAPFLFLSRLDPAGIDFGVAVFNIFAVLLLYFLLKKITNSSLISFALSFSYSVQPQVLWQSRFSWNPNLTPLFMLLFILGFLLVSEKKSSGWMVSSISLGFLLQLHLSTACLIPMVLFFIFLQRKNKKIFDRWFFLSLGVFMIMMLPFLVIELRHDFPNLRNLYKFVTKGPDTNLPPPPLFQGIWEKLRFLFSILPLGINKNLTSALVVAGTLIAFFYSVKKEKQKNKNLLVFYPVLFLILMSVVYRGSFFQYYMTFLYPVTFLILGVIFSSFLKRQVHFLFLLILLPVIFLNIKKDLNIYKAGSTVGNPKSVAAIIASDKEANVNFNIVGIRGDDRYDHNGVDYRYYLETFYNKRALDWDIVDYQDSKILYVVSNLGEIDPLKSNIWEIQLFNPKDLVDQWQLNENTVIYKLTN
ncbi:MAG TPA: glycosyltransferase family 39 protein [Candidatus Bathyarchaeia archaeon]|nr:glycosyltransferase family 39 protein [Candidatus Bathyarchaeia archaeon]HUW24329.1 glycosyltransferase family 39 protein [Patescibacteria group bacterium]